MSIFITAIKARQTESKTGLRAFHFPAKTIKFRQGKSFLSDKVGIYIRARHCAVENIFGGKNLSFSKKQNLLKNPGSTSYQQRTNRPCVIGENSCNNPGGFNTSIIPAGSFFFYDITSPIYTVSQIYSVLQSDTFSVGIDVNTTTQSLATEHLQLFEMTVNDQGISTVFAYQNNDKARSSSPRPMAMDIPTHC